MTKLSAKNRKALPEIEFAFPAQRKEPLEDASHTRSAVSRFNQVQGVSPTERSKAWGRILDAAKKFGVEVHDASWRDLDSRKK